MIGAREDMSRISGSKLRISKLMQITSVDIFDGALEVVRYDWLVRTGLWKCPLFPKTPYLFTRVFSCMLMYLSRIFLSLWIWIFVQSIQLKILSFQFEHLLSLIDGGIFQCPLGLSTSQELSLWEHSLWEAVGWVVCPVEAWTCYP